MPNFNISKGYTNDLANQPIVDGYMYVTIDGQKLYIDDRTSRFVLNAEKADILKGNSLPAVPDTPIAAGEEIPWSWEAINDIALSGKAEEYMSLGAVKTVTLNESILDTTTHKVMVIGINQDNDQSITFQTQNCLNTITAFGSSNAYWTESIIRELCQSYYNAFPGKASIKTIQRGTCKNTSSYSNRNASAIYNDETVFILSEREIGLDRYAPLSSANSTTSNAECAIGKNFTYNYFTDNNKCIKKLGDTGEIHRYWCRSHEYSKTNTGCGVYDNGLATTWTYNLKVGLAPAFIIGNGTLTTDLTCEDIIPRLVPLTGVDGQVLMMTSAGLAWADPSSGAALEWGSFNDLV